jgi:hypothetical protein
MKPFMKTLNLFFLTCLLSISTLNAQNNMSAEKEFNNAENIFAKVYHDGKNESLTYSKEGYVAALSIFLDLYRRDTANMNLAFKVGVCYLSSRKERKEAITYFKKASKAASTNYNESSYKEKNAPLITYK